jgi:hypothetical protein
MHGDSIYFIIAHLHTHSHKNARVQTRKHHLLIYTHSCVTHLNLRTLFSCVSQIYPHCSSRAIILWRFHFFYRGFGLVWQHCRGTSPCLPVVNQRDVILLRRGGGWTIRGTACGVTRGRSCCSGLTLVIKTSLGSHQLPLFPKLAPVCMCNYTTWQGCNTIYPLPHIVNYPLFENIFDILLTQ